MRTRFARALVALIAVMSFIGVAAPVEAHPSTGYRGHACTAWTEDGARRVWRSCYDGHIDARHHRVCHDRLVRPGQVNFCEHIYSVFVTAHLGAAPAPAGGSWHATPLGNRWSAKPLGNRWSGGGL